MRYYPIYLNLTGKPATVIGGGTIAEGKVLGLLEADAQVTVIAPEVTLALHELAANGRITWEQRPYRAGNLAGARNPTSASSSRLKAMSAPLPHSTSRSRYSAPLVRLFP